MMKYLADTNVLSELAKSVPNRAVLEKFRQHRHETATASVVWHELRYGYRRLPVSRKRDALESFLDNVIKPHIIFFLITWNLPNGMVLNVQDCRCLAEPHHLQTDRLQQLPK